MAGYGGSKKGERRGGRKKGTPNVKTVLFESAVERMREQGVDPIKILCQAADGKIKSALRVRAAQELAKYGWAQRRSIEVTGGGGGPVQMEQVGASAKRIASVLDSLASEDTQADTEESK